MGMYDYIGTEQVKCFYIYLYSTNEITPGLWISGGSLDSYKIGDKVPYKTKYYDYTKDFNIVLIDDEYDEYNNAVTICMIRDGILKDIKPLAKTTENDWNILRCISYDGEWLNIYSKEEAEKYVKSIKTYWKEKIYYIKNNMPIRDELNKLTFGIAVIPENEKEKRLQRFKELNDKNNEEQKQFDLFAKDLYNRTLSKFMDIKSDEVLIKETIGAYESVLDLYDQRYNKTKDKDVLIKREKCYNDYIKFKKEHKEA